MINVTTPKFTASNTDEKTSSKFAYFKILKGVSNNIHGVYHTPEYSYGVVDIEASKLEAPEDGW